ncbi:MAG: hypothetical protein WBL93_06485 [Lutisporaceae bacterium]
MINKKRFFRGLSIAMVALMITGAGLLAGCTIKETSKNIEDKEAIQEELQNKIMSDFDALLEGSPKADAVIKFIDENISKISKEDASTMLFKLEDIQKKELPKLEEKYYAEAIQLEMQKLYMTDFDLNKLDETQNKELQDILKETRDMGYKVETAEGMFFPVMNYEFYKKYSAYVTVDIKEYIELMAVESNVTPIKDAALMIGWDEITKRALSQEKFIKDYASSSKVDAIKELQKRYITFILFGSNNTPLFSYDTKVMMTEAQTIFSKDIKDNKDSELMQMLGKYMNILKKTDYKFSEEAEKFRNDVMENNTL